MNKLRFTRIIFALLLLSTTISQQTQAQTELHWFRHSRAAQPYIAEMYSTLPKIEMVKMNKFHPFYLRDTPADRFSVESQAGFQLPFLTIKKENRSGTFSATALSVTSVNTLIDTMEPETAPVVNNDYRLGAKLFITFTPKNSHGFFKNYHITLLPILHESTHIGDEFAIHTINRLDDFMRVNIGYEVCQLFVGFNRDYDIRQPNLSAEIGYQRLLPGESGFYKTNNTEELQGHTITPSKRRNGWFLRGEYSQPLSQKSTHKASFVLSTEIRRDIKFGYTPQNPESGTWIGNLYAGLRLPIINTGYHVGIYLRHYRGVIPYGQMRDVDGFYMTGLSVVVN